MKARYSLLVLLLMMTLSVSLSAQTTKRPDNISISDFDDFKNSSFDIMDNSAALKTNVTTLDDEIKKYSGVLSTLSVDKIKKDLAAVKGSKKEVQILADKIGTLDAKGKDLLEGAKSVTPKMKSLSATSNTNKSLKGLAAAKDNLSAITTLLDADVTLLSGELKKRGEPIE